jgi:hypothetical protein
LMRLPRPGGSFAALDVAAVADQFRVRIERPVIIYLIGQARILAIITAIIGARQSHSGFAHFRSS